METNSKKSILNICNKCKEYSKLDINSKINFKSEIAYYWHGKYFPEFQRHIKPTFQDFKNKEINEFIDQAYFFAVGL